MSSILILHGWGSCAKNWQKVKEGLESRGYKVFLPNLPGFGENPLLEKSWSIDDYVNWVRDFCEKNNLAQFFLLGHSFGGAIATKYSLRFPEDIEKLILVDPAIIRVKDLKKKILTKLSKILKIFSFLPFYPLMRKSFYRFIVKSDYLNVEVMQATRETYLRAIKEDLSDRLSDISVPTVLIWGENDKITPTKDAHLTKERIPGAELETLSDIQHNPQTENPELLVKTILKYL